MATTISIPRKIRQYRLERLLTGGSQLQEEREAERYQLTFEGALPPSLVFRAFHEDLAMDVALRLIPAPDEAAAHLGDQLRELVARMWEFRQDHIVNVIDYGTESGHLLAEPEGDRLPLVLHFFVSEYLRGRQKLAEVLGDERRDLSRHRTLLAQALEALAYTHERRLAHGRLHPGNLLVELRDGELFLRLTDIGHHLVARNGDVDERYRPYFRAASLAQPDEQGDLYSLATIFFELLTGQKPLGSSKAMLRTLQRRYRNEYPELVRTLEAAWSGSVSAAELRTVLALPPRTPPPSFHLMVTQQGEGQYHLRGACPLTGEVAATMALEPLREAVRGLLEALRSGDTLPPEAATLPQALFEALFPPPLAVQLNVARERAKQGAGAAAGQWSLPLLLDFSAATELVEWPWELMRLGQETLALDLDTPVVRVMDSPHPDGNRHLTRPLSLLVVSPQPAERAALDVAGERRKLGAALKWMGRYHYQLIWLRDGSWEAVRGALATHRPNALHFIGHGGLNPVTGEGELSFCRADGLEDRVGARDLAMLLDDHPIELLFLILQRDFD